MGMASFVDHPQMLNAYLCVNGSGFQSDVAQQLQDDPDVSPPFPVHFFSARVVSLGAQSF